MTQHALAAYLLALFLAMLAAPGAFAQTADLSLRISLVPDAPLDAGDQADIVLTVNNLGPDSSGPVRIVGEPIVVTSGSNGSVLFRLTPSSTDPCNLTFIPGPTPIPGGTIAGSPRVLLPSIAPSQSLSCRLRIDVADPLIRPRVMSFQTTPNGVSTDPNPTNNQGSFAVGSDTPRVIPSSGLGALLLLSVATMLLGFWAFGAFSDGARAGQARSRQDREPPGSAARRTPAARRPHWPGLSAVRS
jgi:hypothetical protein